MQINSIQSQSINGKKILLKNNGLTDKRLSSESTVYFDNFFKSKISPMDEDEITLSIDKRQVGVMHYSMTTSDYIIDAKELPNSWLVNPTSDKPSSKMFAYLHLITLDNENRNNGLGREAIKRLYFESCKRGGEGRILCYSAWGSHDFYGKIGFEALPYKIQYSLNSLIAMLYKNFISRIKPQDISQSNITALLKRFMPEFVPQLERMKQKLPYKDDFIIFNPTPENLAKLFVSKHI